MGMIYKRRKVFWIKYYVNGRPVRESSGSEKEGPAKSLMKQREGRAEMGLPILSKAVEQHLDNLEKAYGLPPDDA